MPRSRGSEMPQRQSPRALVPSRTSSSDSDPPRQRTITNRSPKVGGDRRSPRGGTQPDSVNQKKLGTRIADLESQLGQAQEELKVLKDQLASAEAVKQEAQRELERKAEKPIVPEPEPVKEELNRAEIEECNEFSEENQRENDVFEVPVDPKVERNQPANQEDQETIPFISEPAKPCLEDLDLKTDEINSLKAELEEKEKERESFSRKNESLRSQLSEANSEISSAKAKEEEMNSRLTKLALELEDSKANGIMLNEKLEAVEGAKEELEIEMKKMRVQTDQWKKAADAAAAVLAGGAEMNRRRISERCVSMDKHISGVFGTPYDGYMGSPGLIDDSSDDGFGGGKRKTSGIRMFGDLWKKKGQK